MQKQTILCVDDELDNVQALERLFRTKYTVLKATSGKEALEILDQEPGPIALIITDQRMPNMTGVELLAHTIEKFPDTSRLLLTGYTDIESIVQAVNTGQISRYLTKPWDPVDLLATVDQAVEKFVLARELKQKNSELETAYQELKTLDSAKNQFMTLINHELKTPLTAILSFSELLKETSMSEDQALCLDRIQKSGDRLKGLIDDVLIVLGSETKTLKAKIQSVESSTIDLSLPSHLTALMKRKSQDLEIEIVPVKLVADVAMIRQVLLKLIHNAIKFGEEGSVIKVTTEQSSAHRVRFSVINEGSHISPSMIEKIFKPFFIDEDVMNHSSGMGLGLTVCQSLLKTHNSAILIQNLNKGVSVSFEIPSL